MMLCSEKEDNQLQKKWVNFRSEENTWGGVSETRNTKSNGYALFFKFFPD